MAATHPQLVYRSQSRIATRYAEIILLTSSADGRVFRFDEMEYRLVSLFDGTRSLAAAVEAAHEQGLTVDHPRAQPKEAQAKECAANGTRRRRLLQRGR